MGRCGRSEACGKFNLSRNLAALLAVSDTMMGSRRDEISPLLGLSWLLVLEETTGRNHAQRVPRNVRSVRRWGTEAGWAAQVQVGNVHVSRRGWVFWVVYLEGGASHSRNTSSSHNGAPW